MFMTRQILSSLLGSMIGLVSFETSSKGSRVKEVVFIIKMEKSK